MSLSTWSLVPKLHLVGLAFCFCVSSLPLGLLICFLSFANQPLDQLRPQEPGSCRPDVASLCGLGLAGELGHRVCPSQVPSPWHSAPALEKRVLLTVSVLQSWQKHGACIFDRCLETPRHKSKTETTHLPPNIKQSRQQKPGEEQLLFCKAPRVSSRAEVDLSCLPNRKGGSQP